MCGIWALLSKVGIKDFPSKYEAFLKLQNRGPEHSSFDLPNNQTLLGFHRLAIMDVTAEGNQPFHIVKEDGSCMYLICNGEIFNYKELAKEHDIKLTSYSDCEIILHLYKKYGIHKTIKMLDGEYAFVIIDIDINKKTKLYSGRDAIGVRPLFYGIDNDSICLSSEVKGLTTIYKNINVFPPGKYIAWENGVMEEFTHYPYSYLNVKEEEEKTYENLRDILERSVQKRLMSDVPFGCLLSGGLDSSLVCGLAKKILNKSFPVFTIVFENGADLPYAKDVSKYLDLEHHIIKIETEDALKAIDETIYAIESYDITTVRASTMQLLVGKHIKKETNIKMLLVGENSDEVNASYRYILNAPDKEEAKKEAIRLVKDVHRYDGLRTDRTMAHSGLEVRLPFADPEYVSYFLNLDADYFLAKDGMEKYTIRKAFDGTGLIPDKILWRTKNAFSDSVSTPENSWVDMIKKYIDRIVSDEEFQQNKGKYTHCPPHTKESYYYRKKFTEYFGEEESVAKLIPYFWMPKWSPETDDPSARTLNGHVEN